MKRSLSAVIGLTTLLLFGCASEITTQGQVQPAMLKVASLPDLGLAPELSNDTWLNVDSPLRLANLRDARPTRFRAGAVLYTGAQTKPLGDRIWAVPLSALWAD